jgi:drug/metabolite transporter (DMT)-like permease
MALLPGFLGVAIVAWQSVGQNGLNLLPIVWLLGAALSWSVGTVLSRRTSGNVSSMLNSGMQLSLGGAALFVISLWRGEIAGFSPSTISATSFKAAIYLIISGSVIGFAAYHWLLDNVSTSLVSTYTFINPVVAVLLGTMLLDEPFSISMGFGACLIIMSIIVTWRAEHVGSASPRQKRPWPIMQQLMRRN